MQGWEKHGYKKIGKRCGSSSNIVQNYRTTHSEDTVITSGPSGDQDRNVACLCQNLSNVANNQSDCWPLDLKKLDALKSFLQWVGKFHLGLSSFLTNHVVQIHPTASHGAVVDLQSFLGLN